MSLKDNYTNTPPALNEAQNAALSPITTALKNSTLTLDRLFQDIDNIIKSTAKNPNAKLKAIEMALSLHNVATPTNPGVSLAGGRITLELSARVDKIEGRAPKPIMAVVDTKSGGLIPDSGQEAG